MSVNTIASQREITPKINKAELWFLYDNVLLCFMTHCLILCFTNNMSPSPKGIRHNYQTREISILKGVQHKTKEDSDEPVLSCSLTRAFTAHKIT